MRESDFLSKAELRRLRELVRSQDEVIQKLRSRNTRLQAALTQMTNGGIQALEADKAER